MNDGILCWYKFLRVESDFASVLDVHKILVKRNFEPLKRLYTQIFPNAPYVDRGKQKLTPPQ